MKMSLYVNIRKNFGSFELNTEFETSEGVLGILGESGCGKSMTLRCIAGIVTPDEGHIELNGRVFFDSNSKCNLKPQQRHIGLLFQNYALFPNMTVEQNLRMGLKAYEKDPQLIRQKTSEMIERFYLNGLEKNKPAQLSGGQQQRTALARILLSKPELLMLDEPFSALDEFLRWKLELELADVLKEYQGSTLLVSHNRGEIYRICDRVCVMNRGKSSPVVSVGDLFSIPKTRSAAYLSGCKNFSAASCEQEDQILAADWGILLQKQNAGVQTFSCVGVRSHYIRPVSPGDVKTERNLILCRLDRVVEDVFGMIIMLEPVRNICCQMQTDTKNGSEPQRELIRMEISKEVWNAYCRSEDPEKGIYIQIREEDIMLLQ